MADALLCWWTMLKMILKMPCKVDAPICRCNWPRWATPSMCVPPSATGINCQRSFRWWGMGPNRRAGCGWPRGRVRAAEPRSPWGADPRSGRKTSSKTCCQSPRTHTWRRTLRMTTRYCHNNAAACCAGRTKFESCLRASPCCRSISISRRKTR